MIYDKEDEVIKQLFESLLSKYQIGLETLIKGSNFIIDCVNLLYCKCHKINLKVGGSYIVFADCIKNKKAIIKLINDDDKCFKYAATVAVSHEEMGKKLQRISKIKLFTNRYNWKRINSGHEKKTGKILKK